MKLHLHRVGINCDGSSGKEAYIEGSGASVSSVLRITERTVSLRRERRAANATVIAKSRSVAVWNPGNTEDQKEYQFDEIFTPNATQKEIYRHTARALAEDALEGRNGCLAVYGLESSGVEHLLDGNETEGGLITRALDAIFNSIHNDRAEPGNFEFSDAGHPQWVLGGERSMDYDDDDTGPASRSRRRCVCVCEVLCSRSRPLGVELN